jgi:hypothetical protein
MCRAEEDGVSASVMRNKLLAEQFIYVYNNWKKDGELRVAGVDIEDIQNKAVGSDPEPDNG